MDEICYKEENQTLKRFLCLSISSSFFLSCSSNNLVSSFPDLSRSNSVRHQTSQEDEVQDGVLPASAADALQENVQGRDPVLQRHDLRRWRQGRPARSKVHHFLKISACTCVPPLCRVERKVFGLRSKINPFKGFVCPFGMEWNPAWITNLHTQTHSNLDFLMSLYRISYSMPAITLFEK